MMRFEETNLAFTEIIQSMSKKEKDIYIRKNSMQEIISVKIIYEQEIITDNKILERELPDLIMVTKEKERYNLYFSRISEAEAEQLAEKIKKISSQNTDTEDVPNEAENTEEQREAEAERKRLEEEEQKRIEEEERRKAEEKAEEDELEKELLMILENKKTVRAIKVHCEDINQLTYVLKNNINFMSVYYIYRENIKVTQENYAKIFDWYEDLSERYVKVKERDIEYEEVTKEYFEKQLKDIEEVYELLYRSWEIFKAQKKFSKKRFEEVKELFPENIMNEISKRNIFSFLERVVL